jgi:stress response protein SCP2
MRVTKLAPGANANLPGFGPFKVVVTHKQGPDVDLTAFQLQGNSLVRPGDAGDADMVFYNQPKGIGATWLDKDASGGTITHSVLVDPTRWSEAGIERVRIGLTVDGLTFGDVADLMAYVMDGSTVVAEFDLSKRGKENAFIVSEIYRRPDGSIKVRCEAAGYLNGLAGLAKDVGIDVADEPVPAVQEASVNFIKQLAEKPLGANASAIDLRKKSLAVVLVKNNLDGKIFRVVLAIDASGSMDELYVHRDHKQSVVQCSLERMVPIADLLDDNHEMEVWYFGTRPSKTETVTMNNMEGFVDRNGEAKRHAGWSNNEPRVMNDIIKWVKDNPSPYPTIVLAWSDGGVGNEGKIKKVLKDSSGLPIFWMWLGLGTGRDYGILERLDAITGGVVDNCGFFAIDNIENMSDDDLYKKIFEFVSKWYREAKSVGVIAGSH